MQENIEFPLISLLLNIMPHQKQVIVNQMALIFMIFLEISQNGKSMLLHGTTAMDPGAINGYVLGGSYYGSNEIGNANFSDSGGVTVVDSLQ